MKFSVLLAGLLCALTLPYSAGARVRSLSSVAVIPGLHRYSIPVSNCGVNVTHVDLQVRSSDIEVDGVGAIYADGSMGTLAYKQTIPRDFESGWIAVTPLSAVGRCAVAVFVNARSLTCNNAVMRIMANLQ